MSVDLLMVSRGHGKGHAVPDVAIARELSARLPHLRMQFVSYAAGAEAYRGLDHPVIDLGVPDDIAYWDMQILLTRLIAEIRPRFVAAHEEFPALPVAEAFRIPSVFLTDFFMDPTSPPMQVLKYALEVIFLAEPGLFTEPPFLRGRVHYVGRAVRPFAYGLADRERARAELGLPLEAAVALFQPGAWDESRVPIADLVLAAWKALPSAPKRLIWLAGRDYQALRKHLRDDPDVLLLRADWKIDRLMAASDVLLTKANRTTVYEAASLGLPSISLSTAANWPDDVAVAHVPSNTALVAGSASPAALVETLQRAMATRSAPATGVSGGVAGAAARLAERLQALPGDSRA
jgi:UDP-N-acetylglucosamine:LPS N-acetylglucosamine transferase